MAIDPVASAIDAMATYFAGLTGIADALRSWPEHPRDLDLTSGPVVSLTFADEQRTPIPPAAIDDTDPPQYRTGQLAIDVQMDLWTAYRAQRDDAAAVIEAAFHNALPFRHGLLLTTSDYFDRPLTIRASSGRNTGDRDSAEEGMWRRTWMLTVLTDLVDEVPTPTQTTITIRPTVQDVADPDYDIS